ncbi:MAG: MBL fold metallo-hydrolase RNA specificity domain-containing protein [Minisyncoccia bacterium]
MKLTFCGGVGMVTGSNFLLEDGTTKFLVDCGLVQGDARHEALNWEKFPYDASEIGRLAVTHAHIDHIGRIPKLVRDGFRGEIISTEATRELAEPMLMDSMHLLKEVAEHHGRPILYDEKDIAEVLRLWRGVSYHEAVSLPNNISLQFLRAGHILGAGLAKFSRNGRSIVFTGDLGSHSELLEPAEAPEGATYLVMESVYGDRLHDESESRIDSLMRVVEGAVKRGGTLLIPAFSTERTQDLLFDLRELREAKKNPDVPVFLDSPLAIKVTRVFGSSAPYLKPEIATRLSAGEDVFSFPGLRITESAEESRHIDAVPNPKIILAGSGMSSGGRVLSYEREILPDKRSTVCIVGYQSVSSLGRRLMDGAKTVEIQGKKVPVHAHLEQILSYSAHMDSRELVQFAEEAGKPEKIFVVMGEPASSSFLAQRIRDYLGADARVPEARESVEIEL